MPRNENSGSSANRGFASKTEYSFETILFLEIYIIKKMPPELNCNVGN